MGGTKDLTGYKSNGCEVLRKNGSNKNRAILWEMRCHCGEIFVAASSAITSNRVKSCGCSRYQISRETARKIGEANKKHGETLTPLYNVWKGMRYRCYNKRNTSFKNYGGRGITVCDEWKGSFQDFKKWALENGYKTGLSLDRIDNNGKYEPSNCRWTDYKTQARNRRGNVRDYYKGEMRTLSEIAEMIGEKKEFVRYRYINGIDYDKPKIIRRTNR